MEHQTPDPKVTLTFQLPYSLQERLRAEAAKRTTPARKVTVSEIIRELIDTAC
jgi:hypothetical protein